MAVKRSAHAAWDCTYHLVWTPKRRRPVLAGEVGQRLSQLLEEIAQAYDIEIVTMHVAEDHLHLLCCFPPRLSVSEVVSLLKSLSARTLFSEYPSLRKRLWGGALWEGSYFVGTVGTHLDAETVKRYIESHALEGSESASELE